MKKKMERTEVEVFFLHPLHLLLGCGGSDFPTNTQCTIYNWWVHRRRGKVGEESCPGTQGPFYTKNLQTNLVGRLCVLPTLTTGGQ